MSKSWIAESPVATPDDLPFDPSPAEPRPAVAEALAARFRRSQERGARHAANGLVDVEDIPAMMRKEREQMSAEEFAVAESILAECSGRRPRN
jgi:hypothetical protein